jgi:pimeloyl-ACP methyl ester carboxylesterase
MEEVFMVKVARSFATAAGALALAACVAVSALSGQAVAAVPNATAPGAAAGPDVLTVPVRVAATEDGNVGYRELGSGPPLLLIMGFGGTMDNWSASFVDGLAADHKVVVFDNAGVGKTANISPPLTITVMADQTSALISALHLGPTAVLGWSMGGMIAQALTVLHPSQVSRLVLAATQAGTGKAALPNAAASAAAAGNDPGAVLSVLFPASASGAAQLYAFSVLRYPDLYVVTPKVKALQETALLQWFAGSDAAGREVGSVKVPTLVADGTEDALDPVSNDKQLAELIKGAQLTLYPGAGHAFWFQDERAFLERLGEFLG